MKSSRGFTVIELIIVIAFLAVASVIFFVQKNNIEVAGRDDHRVRNVCQPSYIEHLDVDCLHVVKRGRNGFLQRRDALRRAARACTGGHVVK